LKLIISVCLFKHTYAQQLNGNYPITIISKYLQKDCWNGVSGTDFTAPNEIHS